MKKTLLLIFAIFGVLQVSAQDKESILDTTATVSIESISAKLDRLQHDYDYLKCDYELNKVIMDFKDLINTTDISANGLATYCFSGIFDDALYNSYVENYNSKCSLLESLKSTYDKVQVFVVLKSISSNFSQEEIDLLKSNLEFIQQCITGAKSSLEHFNLTIKTFKSIR